MQDRVNASCVVDLTQGRLRRQLVKLSAPIIGTSFIQIAYSFTDIAWVGHLGSEALAAVSAMGVIMWLVWSIGIMVKLGAEVCVSQALGARDPAKAKRYVAHTVTIGAYVGICVTSLLLLLGRAIIASYDFEVQVAQMARHYLLIVSPCYAFTFMSMALTGSYNGSGLSKVPFKVNALGLLVNMTLDPLFIYGFHMGSDGAALATLLANVSVFSLFLYQLRYGRPLIVRDIKLLTRLNATECAHIVKIGAPVSALNALMALVTYAMGTITSRIGGHVGVAVLNAGGQLEAVSWNTAQGFSTALATFVGQNFAAGKKQRIFSALRFVLTITISIGLLATAFYVFLGEPFFRLIVPDPATSTEAGVYYRIVGLSQVFSMVEITIQGLYYGTGRSLTPSLISIGGNVLRIPVALLLVSLSCGLAGIWWTISVSSMIKSVVIVLFLPSLLRFLHRKFA